MLVEHIHQHAEPRRPGLGDKLEVLWRSSSEILASDMHSVAAAAYSVRSVAGNARSLTATIVGWVIVAIVVYLLLGALMTALSFLVRFVIWAVVIGALITLYVNLKSPDN